MNKVLFYHGKTADGRRFTIAGEWRDNVMLLGASICSRKDHFARKIGRAISSGRLNNSKPKGKSTVKLPLEEGRIIKVFVDYVSGFNSLQTINLQKMFNLLEH